MDGNRNPDPGSSRTRSAVFHCPVLFPSGMLYYKSFEAADNARQVLVVARLKESGEIGGSRRLKLRRKCMKGRMG